MSGKISEHDIKNHVAGKPFHMVVIYAPWCSHCNDMIRDLDNKFQQYENLTFLTDKQVDDDFLDHFPHVHVYENDSHRDGTLEELYEILRVDKKGR